MLALWADSWCLIHHCLSSQVQSALDLDSAIQVRTPELAL